MDTSATLTENTFKILLSTDNHLGYGENNPNIENDSLNTFEEVLNIAVKEKVDFILLGGDLFHDARPTPYCINKCIELIKKYCLGDKCVEIEVMSDPSVHFHRNNVVNYEDPNMNIGIPIFSIHGNHDDPTGKKQISALDLLVSMGLLNYFGRWENLDKVEINPILLRKGESLLAIYGLSHIRDERLARIFEKRNVVMKTPENVDNWFNLMVLHQNRANRGIKNYIPDTCIPKFMDLVMWGHEHDCHIEPSLTLSGSTHITQPGSSVATSLSEGEALPKHVGVLRITGKNFNITPVPLQTVRPFIFKSITLDPPAAFASKVSHAEKAKEVVKREIKRMIQEANNLGRIGRLSPLLRLNVKFVDERQVFNAIRFGQEFVDQVANPEDMIKFANLGKKVRSKGIVADLNVDQDEDEEEIERVEDLIPKFLTNENSLKVLNIDGMNEAVKRCIDNNDSGAPATIISDQENFLLQKLIELKPDEEDVINCLKGLQKNRKVDQFQQVLNNANRPNNSQSQITDSIVISDDDSDSINLNAPTPTRGRGSRGRGRGSRGRAKK